MFATLAPHSKLGILGSEGPLQADGTELDILRHTYGIVDPKPFTNTLVEYDFDSTRPDELSVKRGETISVLHSFKDHWSLCKKGGPNSEDGDGGGDRILGMVPSDRLGLIDLPIRPKQPVEGRPRSPSTLPRITSVQLQPRQVDRSTRSSILSLLEFLQSTRVTRRRTGDSERRIRSRRSPLEALKGHGGAELKDKKSKESHSKSSRRVRFGFPLTREFFVPKSEAKLTDSDDESFKCKDDSSQVDNPVTPVSDVLNALREESDSDSYVATPKSSPTSSRTNSRSSQYSQSSLEECTEALPSEDTSSNDPVGSTHNDNLPCLSTPSTDQSQRFLLSNSCTSQRMIYRNLLSFLIGETLPTDMLWPTLQDCLSSLQSLDLVSSLVQSHDYRMQLLKVASALNISRNPMIRKALQEDENEIAEILHLVSLSESSRRAVLTLEGDDAQKFLDAVQDVLDKGYLLDPKEGPQARHLLVRLSETCDKLPSSLFINGVTRPDQEEQAVYGGGFGDVYRALYHEQVVALKRMRTFQRNSGMANARRRFCREALVWQQLNSAFIVPFFGIDNESFPGFMCLVSPWMRNGTILKHLEEHGKADVDERLHEIAQGLAYLHSQNIIHGDLRGSNILINDQWQACLTDFGLTVFDDTTLVPLTSRHEGSVRWMAPELHMPESFGLDRFRLTVKTDVYAFGCVSLELYTGNAPFSELAHDTAVMLRVLKGERPSRPTGAFKMSDGLWEIVGRCWSHNHEERSEADKLVENIGCIINSARGHNEVDHDCPDTQALSTPSSAEITDVSPEAHLPSEFEPVKLLEKPSLESLSVYRLSSFPFVDDDPFAASQDWLQTPDSPLLPSLILTEAQDSVQERQPDVLEAASSSHSPSVSASREWGSNEPALAVQELEDIVNSMTPPISSPLAEDCCLDKCQRTIPPDALDVQQKDGHDVTAGEELAAAWSDCMQLYKEAVGNRDRTPSEILDSQDDNGAPESHLIRTLQAVIDLNGLLLELEDRHVPSQSNETRTGYIRLLQPPLHSTPDCPSLLGLKDQSSCATAPLEHTAICQEFEHELDVAFDRDFSLSDLEKKPDRQVVGPQTMDEDVKESSHTYTVLCEFLAIFVISVAIYALFSYFCFGGLVLQPVLMNMY